MYKSPTKLYRVNEYIAIDDAIDTVTRTGYVTASGSPDSIQEQLKQYAIDQVEQLLGCGEYPIWMDVFVDIFLNMITIKAFDQFNGVHAYYSVDFESIW